MPEHGPFESDDEVRALPEVAAIYEAYDHGFGTGNLSGAPLITAACEAAGVVIGAYDARTIEWMGNWEPHTCAVFAGLIVRAREAGKAAATAGAETQWGLRLLHEPDGEPIFDPYPSEEAARSMVATFQGVFDTVVVSRRLGPWKEAPDV